MAKIGDTVRFLNSVGGGKIVRIEGQIAYIDDDGFETPALLRECVVVASGDSFYKSETRSKAGEKETIPTKPEKQKPAPATVLPPMVETPEGEKINLVIGFEPVDIKHLSTTSFDAYIVNDSNYSMYLTVATRPSDRDKWTCRYSGFIEAAVQEHIFELEPADLTEIDRISVQGIAYKPNSNYTLKPAFSYEHRLDATKFARLHCFLSNPYFDGKVIALDIVKDDVVQIPVKLDSQKINEAINEKRKADTGTLKYQKVSKPAQKPGVIEVDLHATELLDNLNGLSKAEILNYQVDTFRKVMDENLRRPGTKIIFIHGKGEGVLRQALMKELNNRYKGHDVADASFREYGFGATQVTIKSIKR